MFLKKLMVVGGLALAGSMCPAGVAATALTMTVLYCAELVKCSSEKNCTMLGDPNMAQRMYLDYAKKMQSGTRFLKFSSASALLPIQQQAQCNYQTSNGLNVASYLSYVGLPLFAQPGNDTNWSSTGLTCDANYPNPSNASACPFTTQAPHAPQFKL